MLRDPRITKWTKNLINKRTKELVKYTLETWTELRTRYKTSIESKLANNFNNINSSTRKKISLADTPDSFKNINVETLYLDNSINNVKNWKEVLLKTCEFLYMKSPDKFEEIRNKRKGIFNVEKSRSKLEFRKNKWISADNGTQKKLENLKKIAKYIEYPLTKICFTVYSKKSKY